MNYISAEEFLNQDKKVQEVFLDWWQPSEGDLLNIDYEIDFVMALDDDYICGYEYAYTKEEITCPLLTEGQLRQFIEDKMKCIVENAWDGLDYDIYLVDKLTGVDVLENYFNLGNDLLKAYWKVACEIAKNEVLKDV